MEFNLAKDYSKYNTLSFIYHIMNTVFMTLIILTDIYESNSMIDFCYFTNYGLFRCYR